jgi:hypothetical protein
MEHKYELDLEDPLLPMAIGQIIPGLRNIQLFANEIR